MNGIVCMKAPEETGVDCQNGWYQWPKTQSATELVNTEAQTAEEDLCSDCSRMTARFQHRAF